MKQHTVRVEFGKNGKVVKAYLTENGVCREFFVSKSGKVFEGNVQIGKLRRERLRWYDNQFKIIFMDKGVDHKVITSGKKVLRLTLKKRWFDMFAAGVKKEEYRVIKQYWLRQLCEQHPSSVVAGGDLYDVHLRRQFSIKHFDVVEFRNGYSSDAPTIAFECSDITVGTGNTDWGAEEGVEYFVIKCGKELYRFNL